MITALWIFAAVVVVGLAIWSVQWAVLANRRLGTLKELGFPSHEELASVGLTGQQFYCRYIRPREWMVRARRYDFNQCVLDDFWADYPRLDRRKQA